MYLYVLDHAGKILMERNVRSNREILLRTLAPYCDHLVVAAKCTCT